MANFQHYSRPGPPKHQGVQTAHCQPVHVALLDDSSGGLVLGLPAVPEGEGFEAASGDAAVHRQACALVWPPVH
jgi:hypothetical protein